MPSDTRYARNGDVTLAWTEVGEGALDLVFIPGFLSHVEHFWEEPGLAAFFERIGRFARVILMDRRGVRPLRPARAGPDARRRGADVLAVLDAAGSERAVLFGYTMGGAVAVARSRRSRPSACQALVLYAAMVAHARRRRARLGRHAPSSPTPTGSSMAEQWGTGANLDIVAPSRVDDARHARLARRAWSACRRARGDAARWRRPSATNDVRADLPELNVPTLILHRTGDR